MAEQPDPGIQPITELKRTTMKQDEKKVWVIRAGKYGTEENFALENNCVVVKWWIELPDLNDLDEEKIKELIAQHREKIPNPKGIHHQALRFRDDPREGELVILPLKGHRNHIAIGEIRGAYKYHEEQKDNGTAHQYPVEWLNKLFLRDRLPDDLYQSIKSQSTVFTLGPADADARIRALLN